MWYTILMRAAYALQGAAFILLIIMAGVLFSRSAHAPPAAQSDLITNVTNTPMEMNTTFSLTSPAFVDGTAIPSAYTCDGKNVHPELQILGVPEGTKSLALIVDDPDSPTGTWDHWIVFNIPATTTLIEEGKSTGGVEGVTTFGTTGYGGPCPGQGEHHYQFKLYALDTMLDLQEGATKQAVEQSMQGHILAETKLVGLYTRNKE